MVLVEVANTNLLARVIEIAAPKPLFTLGLGASNNFTTQAD
jgi:hypothetical protein